MYVDDGILCGPSATDIQTIIKELGALYNITDEGDNKLVLLIVLPAPPASGLGRSSMRWAYSC
jgi:hypothetical protein